VPEEDKPDVFIKPAPPIANETVQVEKEREREAAKAKPKPKPKSKPKPSLDPLYDFPDLPDIFKDALKQGEEKERDEAEAKPSANPIFDIPDSLKDSIHVEMEEIPDDEDDYGIKLPRHEEL
jgi:hypothetical protein